MDFKKLAQCVMLAGLAVFIFGAYKYHAAKAATERAIRQASGQMGFFGAALVGMDAQMHQASEQNASKAVIAVGGGLILLGYGLAAAAIARDGEKKDHKS